MTRRDALLKMRQVLMMRREGLRRALNSDLSLLKELQENYSEDSADMDFVKDEISFQLAEVESRELRRIEHALERMREGQYGICEACAANIPVARLSALPYATLCISCQREAERQAGAGQSPEIDWGQLLDSSFDTDRDLSIDDVESDGR